VSQLERTLGDAVILADDVPGVLAHLRPLANGRRDPPDVPA
jgi:hypothetical protein